ncbi:DUF2490 domain-containing protein [uncultured Dokdonia sp.]|uniref:DUF2490 domain-containing protein n=1 Tax=uncultured Dokdonia sp. TaxID=575653 RepID=UPI002633D053|nr:DUF2490 domain-containing protein [uncultured Dokdonia sp.]
MKKYHYIIIICLLTYLNAQSQSVTNVGTIPKLNIKKKFENLWSVNLEIAPRVELAEGSSLTTLENSTLYTLTDITTVVSRTLGVSNSIGAGYLTRLEKDRSTSHRFIQQYVLIDYKGTHRIAHRFRTDQTFRQGGVPTFRARYRISSDIALRGQTIDPNEFYFKISNEYLGILRDQENDIEIRLTPTLGYNLKNKNKIELGLDYRIDSFINSSPDHRYWIQMGYYFPL